jgi:ferredoxin-NADP reductase
VSPRLWDTLRNTASALTTPLLPDDYTQLINPLWSARELRGRVEQVVPETDDAATLVIRPGWGWSFDHQPGQFVGIGVDVGGRWHWRSYSLTSPPTSENDCITITVKAMPEGFLSEHLVRGLEPGTVIRLAQPSGEFVLPDPPPHKLLFWTGGSGVTPVMGMLRTLARRGTMPDVVHIHSAPSREAFLFADELGELADRFAADDGVGYRLVTNLDDVDGIFTLDRLDDACPDWRERQTWVCGPPPMLEAAEEHWKAAGLDDELHIERFQPTGFAGADDGAGGEVTYAASQQTVEVDGATTLLEKGEELGIKMPYGCRMGICHTCSVRLIDGAVVDLRNGEQHANKGEMVQTCVSAVAANCTLDI